MLRLVFSGNSFCYHSHHHYYYYHYYNYNDYYYYYSNVSDVWYEVGGSSCFLFEESIFIIAGFMEKFFRIKQPENKGGNLFSFDAAIADGWVEPQLLRCRKLPPVLIYYLFFLSAGVFIIHLDIARENHRRSSSSASS